MKKKNGKKNGAKVTKLFGEFADYTKGETSILGTCVGELTGDHFVGAYSDGKAEGTIDVRRSASGDWMGQWAEKGDGKGAAALRLTTDIEGRHVFHGTWSGSGGPGRFLFTLAVGEPPAAVEGKGKK